MLFHVTANAEWSSLPLSGLFVQMLERLAVSTRPSALSEEAMEGTRWVPRVVLDGFGVARDAGALAGVPGEELTGAMPSAELPPGLYEGPGRSLALNVLGADAVLAPCDLAGGNIDRRAGPDRGDGSHAVSSGCGAASVDAGCGCVALALADVCEGAWRRPSYRQFCSAPRPKRGRRTIFRRARSRWPSCKRATRASTT